MWDTKDPWLTGYTRVAGKVCVECGKCEEMYPQGLPIHELLKETARIFAKQVWRC